MRWWFTREWSSVFGLIFFFFSGEFAKSVIVTQSAMIFGEHRRIICKCVCVCEDAANCARSTRYMVRFLVSELIKITYSARPQIVSHSIMNSHRGIGNGMRARCVSTSVDTRNLIIGWLAHNSNRTHKRTINNAPRRLFLFMSTTMRNQKKKKNRRA